MEQGLALALQPLRLARRSVLLARRGIGDARGGDRAAHRDLRRLLPVSRPLSGRSPILPFVASAGPPTSGAPGRRADDRRRPRDAAVRRRGEGASTGRPNGVGEDVEQQPGRRRHGPRRAAAHGDAHGRAHRGAAGRRRDAVVGREYEVYDAALPALARTIAGRRGESRERVCRARGPRWPGRRRTTPPTTRISAGARCSSSATPDSLTRSLEYFQQAAKLDPSYADAVGGHGGRVHRAGRRRRSARCRRSRHAGSRRTPLTQRARARIPTWSKRTRRWPLPRFFTTGTGDGAEMRFKKAIALNRSVRAGPSLVRRLPERDGAPRGGDGRNRPCADLEPLSILIDRDVGVAPLLPAAVRRGDRAAASRRWSGTRRIRRRAPCSPARWPNRADTPKRSSTLRLAAPAMTKTRGVNLGFRRLRAGEVRRYPRR